MGFSMNIAILGATSQIAKDLIISFANNERYKLFLFGRNQTNIHDWCLRQHISNRHEHLGYDAFSHTDHYDVIINFVGVGDPAVAKQMGSAIFDVTYQYDKLAIDYLQQYPQTKYIFLSSGAVFGGNFEQPVTEDSVAQVDLNHLQESDWYGIAKLYAEARHRALKDCAIVDVRVFNYFSRTQDMNARFLITDIVRAIQNNEVLKTAETNIVRDFISPVDFSQLIKAIIESPAMNCAVDCYTQAPIDKLSLLKSLQEKFGLRYELVTSAGLNATGAKINYYSTNKKASEFGYAPSAKSEAGVALEITRYLTMCDHA
jgi:nucleoside-diphosphate-sugar epimerase